MLYMLYWRWHKNRCHDDDTAASEDNTWTNGMLWIGLLSVLFTITPVILANRMSGLRTPLIDIRLPEVWEYR